MLLDLRLQKGLFTDTGYVGVSFYWSWLWNRVSYTVQLAPILVFGEDIINVDWMATSKSFNKYGDKDCMHFKISGARPTDDVPEGYSQTNGPSWSGNWARRQTTMTAFCTQKIPVYWLESLDLFNSERPWFPRCGGYTNALKSGGRFVWPVYIPVGAQPYRKRAEVCLDTVNQRALNFTVAGLWDVDLEYSVYPAALHEEPEKNKAPEVFMATWHDKNGDTSKAFTYRLFIRRLSYDPDLNCYHLQIEWWGAAKYRAAGNECTLITTQNVVAERWFWPRTEGTVVPSTLVPEAVRDKFVSDIRTAYGFESANALGLRMDIMKDAIDQLRRVHINTIAYLGDLYDLWADTIKPLWTIRHSLKNPATWKRMLSKFWDDPANLSDLYLNYRYGLRLFILDSIELFEGLRSEWKDTVRPRKLAKGRGRRRMESKQLGNNARVTYTCEFKTSWVPQIEQFEDFMDYTEKWCVAFRKWDLVLTPSNLWDLIPYSFVIDWIIPIGDMLAEMETIADAVAFKIEYQIYGVKVQLDVTSDQVYQPIPGWTDYTVSWYERTHKLGSSLDTPSFSDEIGGGITRVHTMDALALVFSRRPWRHHSP